MTRYSPSRQTGQQWRQRDARIQDVLAAHQLGLTEGGTATGSTCLCTCGEDSWTNGTRGMAGARARAHVAHQIGLALNADVWPPPV